MRDARRVEPARELLDAAYELARSEGVAAVTARALAQRAGGSASAMTYHFGSRAALLARLCERASQTLGAWRANRAPAPGGALPAWLSLPGYVAATLADLLDARRDELLMMAEFEAAAVMGPGPLDTLVWTETAASEQFWIEATTALGSSAEAAEAWTNLALGLVDLLASEPAAPVRAAWILEAVLRLDARLARRPIAPGPRPIADPAQQLLADAPSSEGARRILEAALRVIGEQGLEHLTQRKVAAEAGLSLAATTYFFRSKAELVRAAFMELHRQIRAELLDAPAQADRSEGFGAGFVTGTAYAQSWRPGALKALGLAAARDPALQPLVQSLRATRGATSFQVLRARGYPIDALDAFIWSTSMSGLSRRATLADAGRREALAIQTATLLPVVFGTA